jgi:putative oxidoreductase
MLTRLLTAFTEPAYALLRIVSGLLFSMHGMQILFGLFSDSPGPAFGEQQWFGGVMELTTGILIAIGLFTRSAALLASGTMAVAYFQFHWKMRFDANFFPIVNHGELAALNAFLFLFLACRGAGICSVDRARAGRERK